MRDYRTLFKVYERERIMVVIKMMSDLSTFRAYSDLGSFYLFIYKDETLTGTVTEQGYCSAYRKRYMLNVYALSTPIIEYALGYHIVPRSSGNYEHENDSILNNLRDNYEIKEVITVLKNDLAPFRKFDVIKLKVYEDVIKEYSEDVKQLIAKLKKLIKGAK